MREKGARLGWQATDYPDEWWNIEVCPEFSPPAGIFKYELGQGEPADRPILRWVSRSAGWETNHGELRWAEPRDRYERRRDALYALPPERTETSRRYRDLEERWRDEYLRKGPSARLAANERAPTSHAGEAVSVTDYALKRWIPRRRADGLSNADDDGRALENHVLPEIGKEDIRTIPRARLAALRDEWNARSVLPRKNTDFLAWKTGRNLWGLLSKMFADACHPDAGHADPRNPGSLPLHVRDDDPTEKIKPPMKRGERTMASLWPKDVADLLTCSDVPMHWRVLYAVAIYLGLRQSELRALKVGSIDLDNDLVRVAKKISRKTGKEEHTKTKKTGWAPIEDALKPLLAALVEGRDASEPLLWMPPEEDLAENLRQKHLPRAGVSRSELFDDDEARQRFNFHGCRHTHLTFRAGRGDNVTDLMGSVLHADLMTTMQYIDQAVLQSLRRQRDRIFAPLPDAIVEGARGGSSPERTRDRARTVKARGVDAPIGFPKGPQRVLVATPTGIEENDESRENVGEKAAVSIAANGGVNETLRVRQVSRGRSKGLDSERAKPVFGLRLLKGGAR